MSKDNRALKFEEIKQLLKKDGHFVQDTRFERTPDPSFKPWGKQSFRVINEFVPEPEPEVNSAMHEEALPLDGAETIAEDGAGDVMPPAPPPPKTLKHRPIRRPSLQRSSRREKMVARLAISKVLMPPSVSLAMRWPLSARWKRN